MQVDFFSAITDCSTVSPRAGHTCMASCSVDHAGPDLWARRVCVLVRDADADVGAQARRRGRELSYCKVDWYSSFVQREAIELNRTWDEQLVALFAYHFRVDTQSFTLCSLSFWSWRLLNKTEDCWRRWGWLQHFQEPPIEPPSAHSTPQSTAWQRGSRLWSPRTYWQWLSHFLSLSWTSDRSCLFGAASVQTARHLAALMFLAMAMVAVCMLLAGSGSADLLLRQTRFYFEYATLLLKIFFWSL